MTENDQRIAIAEWCGWKNCRCLKGGNVPFGEPDDDYNQDYPNNPHREELPDYPHDLNAMHESEKHFKDKAMYIAILRKVIQSQENIYYDSLEACIFATAAQRAEALLRIIGKWKD